MKITMEFEITCARTREVLVPIGAHTDDQIMAALKQHMNSGSGPYEPTLVYHMVDTYGRRLYGSCASFRIMNERGTTAVWDGHCYTRGVWEDLAATFDQCYIFNTERPMTLSAIPWDRMYIFEEPQLPGMPPRPIVTQDIFPDTPEEHPNPLARVKDILARAKARLFS